MPPAAAFTLFAAPGGTLPEIMQQWPPQGFLFRRTTLSEYVLVDAVGGVYAQLQWSGDAPGGEGHLWNLKVRQQQAAWCYTFDWPVQADGTAIQQHWFGGSFPSQQMPLGCVCWPENAPAPTWAGICPQPPPQSRPAPLPPPPDASRVLAEIRELRGDLDRRAAEDWAAYEERCWAIEQQMAENWYAQEASLATYYEQAQDVVNQVQQSAEGAVERLDERCKGLEQRSKEVEESCLEAVEQRCQAAEVKSEAAVHMSEFMLADAKSDLEAYVRQRVDDRIDRAFQCIAQRVQGVQLSLQATGLGLQAAILDGKVTAGEGESESTRSSRSRSRSPLRGIQGL